MLKRLVASAAVSGALIAGLNCAVASLAEPEKAGRPKMDVAFLIDTTGSMQGEIDMVKAKVKELVAKLGSGKPAPEIRVGLVAYRDRSDDYVTKIFPFTDDIDKIVKDISDLKADGGGDGPEAVNQALHSAVHELKWDGGKKTAKLLFLIGDAGPHYYAGDYDWRTESKQAIEKGIQINTIGCAGLESYPSEQGVGVFKEIARLADGKYDTLAYRQEVTAADGRKETYISSGGSFYKVKSSDKDAWRAGAAKLAAEGKAEAVPAASPVPASVHASLSLPGGYFRSSGRAYEGASAGAPARADSNLADVLLDRAKQAARKSLGVEYGR